MVERTLRDIEPVEGSEFIFTNPQTKKPYTTMWKPFTKAVRDAGLEDVTLHTLRHTALTWIVNLCGIDLVTAKEIAGHSDIRMTERYVHTNLESKKRAMMGLGDILEQKAENFGTQRDDRDAIQTQYSRKSNMISSLPTN